MESKKSKYLKMNEHDAENGDFEAEYKLGIRYCMV